MNLKSNSTSYLYASDGHRFHIVPDNLKINQGLCGEHFEARRLGKTNNNRYATYRPANIICVRCEAMMLQVWADLLELEREGVFI